MNIQISIGVGSMGMAYRTITGDELQQTLAEVSQSRGCTVAELLEKLNNFSCLKRNPAVSNEFIRGQSDENDAAVSAAREAAAAKRKQADGYENE